MIKRSSRLIQQILEDRHKKATPCFQWIEDLRHIFLEAEDEQRATIHEDKSTEYHVVDKDDDIYKTRNFIKDLGLRTAGLDYASVSEVCVGNKDKLTFTLFLEPQKDLLGKTQQATLKNIGDKLDKRSERTTNNSLTALIWTAAEVMFSISYNTAQEITFGPIEYLVLFSAVAFGTYMNWKSKEEWEQFSDKSETQFQELLQNTFGLKLELKRTQNLASLQKGDEINMALEYLVTINKEDLLEDKDDGFEIEATKRPVAGKKSLFKF